MRALPACWALVNPYCREILSAAGYAPRGSCVRPAVPRWHKNVPLVTFARVGAQCQRRARPGPFHTKLGFLLQAHASSHPVEAQPVLARRRRLPAAQGASPPLLAVHSARLALGAATRRRAARRRAARVCRAAIALWVQARRCRARRAATQTPTTSATRRSARRVRRARRARRAPSYRPRAHQAVWRPMRVAPSAARALEAATRRRRARSRAMRARQVRIARRGQAQCSRAGGAATRAPPTSRAPTSARHALWVFHVP